MTQEYEDIKCFACGQVRGKRKVVHLSQDDKAQFVALEAKIRGHTSLSPSTPTWTILAGLLPVLVSLAVAIYDKSMVEAWPRDNILMVFLPYYTLWVIAYLWIHHQGFKKYQARVQALFRQERELLSKYGVEAKDDYIIR